jgi:uncharacterized cupin superfamily protein
VTRPAYVVHTASVPAIEAAYPPPFDAEKLSIGRDLGTAAGSVRLGVWHERLLPGRRSSFTHAHSDEEEAVYVLAGSPHLRVIPPGAAAEEHALAPGDFVSFPAGTGIAHCLVNHGPEEVTMLVIGERREGDRACYPDDSAFEAWHTAERPDRHWLGAPDHQK